MYTINPKTIMKMFLKRTVTNKPKEEINWKYKYLTHTNGRKRKTDVTNSKMN